MVSSSDVRNVCCVDTIEVAKRAFKKGIQPSRCGWTPRSVTRTSQRKKGRRPQSSSRCPYPGVLDILPLLMLRCIILS